MEMVWQDPPERERSSKWTEIAEQLAERPGQWALLNKYDGDNAKRNAYSLAGRVRKILNDQYGKGEYELTSRSVSDIDAGVWGRKTMLTDDQLLEALADEAVADDDVMGELS